MSNPYRALCAELLQELCCHYRSWELKEGYYSDVMKRANALLDQPEPPELTDEELDALERQCWEATGVVNEALQKEELFDYRAFARAAIAADRARRPTPQPPAADEVVNVSQLSDGYHTLAQDYIINQIRLALHKEYGGFMNEKEEQQLCAQSARIAPY